MPCEQGCDFLPEELLSRAGNNEAWWRGVPEDGPAVDKRNRNVLDYLDEPYGMLIDGRVFALVRLEADGRLRALTTPMSLVNAGEYLTPDPKETHARAAHWKGPGGTEMTIVIPGGEADGRSRVRPGDTPSSLGSRFSLWQVARVVRSPEVSRQ